MNRIVALAIDANEENIIAIHALEIIDNEIT